MKYHFFVTQNDIDWGQVGEGSACPVTLAIQRRLGPNAMIHTSKKELVLKDQQSTHGRRRILPLPNRVAEWVNNFDEEGHSGVKPFRFSLYF